jgi:hypothetical protein
VAFFSLVLFLSLSAVVKRQNQIQRWIFSGLGLGMVVLVGVMLFSAFQRLMLYEAAYGFSRLRAYTHVFMIWLGVLLAAVVVLEILRKERTFALAALLASIGFGVTLSLLNVDGFIVRQNVARRAAGSDLDVAYLASLSSDSIPALVNAFQDGRLDSGTRDAVGAALACHVNAERSDNVSRNWRSFTLSRWWADHSIGQSQVKEKLNNYVILEEDRSIQVETPNGEIFDCLTTVMN